MAANYATVAQLVSQLGMIDDEGARFVASDGPSPAITVPSETELTEYLEEAESELEELCDTKWIETIVTGELHSFPNTQIRRYRSGMQIQLNERYITEITTLELWNGSVWEELLDEGSGPRDGDFYINLKMGLLYINGGYAISWYEDGIRVAYKYGQSSAPPAIRRAIRLMAGATVIEAGLDWVHVLVPIADGMSHQQKAEAWRKTAENIAKNFKVSLPIPQY